MSSEIPRVLPNRRGFLKGICAATAAASLASTGRAEDGAVATPAPGGLPTIALGPHRITRLVSGGNPVCGFSHSTQNSSRHMLEYFTIERTVEYLLEIERAGINTWQFDHMEKPVQALRMAREKGSKLKFICIHHQGRAPMKKMIEEMSPIAVLHHGGVTDSLFKQGKASEVHDFVKQVHDMGLLAGVSSHCPTNIQRIADEGWEVDLFMTCFYYVTRPVEEQMKLLGKVVVDEPFFESDPVEMTSVIQKVPKPCLAFKILAAGRRCWNQGQVEAAFQFAYERIKKTDAVIVGMFPRYEDEIRLNVSYAMKYGKV
jgi:hypothetical protein